MSSEICVKKMLSGHLWKVSGPRAGGDKTMEYGRITITASGKFEAHGYDPSHRQIEMGTFVVQGPTLGAYGTKREAVDAILRYARTYMSAEPASQEDI